jgi:hypothetical protein
MEDLANNYNQTRGEIERWDLQITDAEKHMVPSETSGRREAVIWLIFWISRQRMINIRHNRKELTQTASLTTRPTSSSGVRRIR